MKKEHWLYVIIAVLAIWIIASYATAPKSEAPTSEDTDLSVDGATDTNDTISATDPDGDGDDHTAPNPSETTTAAPVNPVVSEIGSNSIVVVDQPAGGMVSLGSVTMGTTGWVVVQEEVNGVPGWILGAQRFDAGTYPSGQVELLRGTKAGLTYRVMFYKDNGDKQFDHKVDQPVSINGSTVLATFVAK